MSATTHHLSRIPEGRTKPDQYGRIKETWPPVPVPDLAVIAAFEPWLRDHRNAARNLPVCAPLLAMICALHEAGHYLPTRERLAKGVEECRQQADPTRAGKIRKGKAVATSVHSIDAALSTAAGLGDTEETYRTEDGDVTNRKSIRRHRYVAPSKMLLTVYRRAVKKHAEA